jgi:hypothetical protein
MLAPIGLFMTAQFGSTEPDCTAQACSCPAFLAVGNCTYPAYGGGGNCIPAGGNGNLCRANAWAIGRQVGSASSRPYGQCLQVLAQVPDAPLHVSDRLLVAPLLF